MLVSMLLLELSDLLIWNKWPHESVTEKVCSCEDLDLHEFIFCVELISQSELVWGFLFALNIYLFLIKGRKFFHQYFYKQQGIFSFSYISCP